MSNVQKESYEIDAEPPDTEMDGDTGPDGDKGDDEIDLVADEPDEIRKLDGCPSCGAEVPRNGLVCLRCGFNLKTLRVESTATGEEEISEEPAGEETGDPVSVAGRGDYKVPMIMAAAGVLVLLIGYLSGATGLFDLEEAASFGTRFSGLLQEIVFIGLLAAAGLGGVFVVARFVHRGPIGDIPLAAARLLGIVSVTRVTALIDLPSVGLEWTVELLIQVVIAGVLALYFFSLDVRDAILGTTATVAIVIGLTVLSAMVWWAQ